MKKIVCLLLALLMIISVFAGCGSAAASAKDSAAPTDVVAASEALDEADEAEEAEEAEEADEDVADEVEESAEASAEEPEEPEAPAHELPLTEDDVTLSMFVGMNPNLMPVIETYAETGIIRWLTEVTGVKMDIPAVHPASEAEQWTLMAASGDFADLMCSIGNYAGGAQGALDDEIIYDLATMEEQMPYFFKMLESDPAVEKDCKLDSGSIATTYRVISGDYYRYDYGPLVRADWLKALNLDVPETYDEYYEVLKAFKSEYGATMWMSGSQTSILSLGYNIRCGYTFGRASGLDCFYVDNGKIECGFYQPEFKEYLEMIQKWEGEGLVTTEFATISSDYVNSDGTSFAAVTSDKHGIWKEEANGMNAYSSYDMELVAAPLARKNAGDIISVEAGKTRVDGAQLAITTSCEYPELAAEWLDMWYSDEATIVANWGLEGEGFVYDENGNPTYTELITDNPGGLARSFARELYTAPTGGYMYDMQTVYSLWSETQLACCDVWAQNMDQSKTMPSFVSRTTEESEEFASISGDMITYVSETLSKLMLGELNLDSDLDNFIATIKDMGMDRLVELQQIAYDRYAAR